MSTEGKLEIKDEQSIADELNIHPEEQVVASEEDVKLARQAEEVVAAIMSIDAKDLQASSAV